MKNKKIDFEDFRDDFERDTYQLDNGLSIEIYELVMQKNIVCDEQQN